MHRKGNVRELGYRFMVLRTLLALMLGGLSPVMQSAAQEGQPVAQEEQPVDEQPAQEQLFEDEWLPKDSQARYGDDLDLVFPQSQNLFVEMAASDTFGYTWSELAGAPWEDITGQGALEFNDLDDGFAGPVAIGFSFPFYEKAYTQLYVSTDGLVTLENGVIDTSNQLLPHDVKPNNLIAPLWMDLNTCHVRPCTNKVFTKLLSSPDRFVIQWTEVVRYGSTEKQTFQVVLYKTGNIEFRYKTITGNLGEYTIGIEDRDGADGLTYSYNGSPPISSGKAVRFIRPAAAPRVKVTPLYQSGFVIRKEASIPVTVHNTGNSASQDTLNLQILPADPNWKITLYRANGITPLTDTNGDGLVDTGPLAYGGSLRLVVRLRAPAYVSSGDTFHFQLRASSSLSSTVQAEIPIQVAVPAPFAQTLSDNYSGVWLDTIWGHSWRRTKVSQSIFTGNTMSVSGLGRGSYVYLWERNGYNTATNANYTNIEYVVLNQTANLIKGIQKLTQTDQSATSTIKVDARYPTLATAPNGTVGIVWTENRLNQLTGKKLTNIYFALMNGQGQVIHGPANLTSSSEWLDTSLYRSPVIAATGDNRFTIVWLATRAGTTELTASIYSSSGALQGSPRVLFHESGAASDLLDPLAIEMTGNRVFAAVTLYEENEQNPIYRIHYGFVDSGGNTLKPFTPILDSSGLKADAVQVSTGQVVLAWSNPTSNTITVTALSDSSYAILTPAYNLPPIGSRWPDYVSMTREPGGRAVLTWMDFKQYDHLFYALLDGNAAIVTPPMIFTTGAADEPLIQTSFASHGNAPYLGAWDVFLPTLAR
jgi:hypothetical protein